MQHDFGWSNIMLMHLSVSEASRKIFLYVGVEEDQISSFLHIRT
jgi:hypothetical protein